MMMTMMIMLMDVSVLQFWDRQSQDIILLQQHRIVLNLVDVFSNSFILVDNTIEEWSVVDTTDTRLLQPHRSQQCRKNSELLDDVFGVIRNVRRSLSYLPHPMDRSFDTSLPYQRREDIHSVQRSYYNVQRTTAVGSRCRQSNELPIPTAVTAL